MRRWIGGSIYGKPVRCKQSVSFKAALSRKFTASVTMAVWLFVCSLFNDAVSDLDHAGLNDWMRVNNGIENVR